MPTATAQPNMSLDPKTIKEAITTKFPSMSRYRKIRLATSIIPAYELACEASLMLGKGSPPEPDPINCDIDEDYVILRDSESNSIADVYIGTTSEMTGHVVFQDGNELTEHEKHLMLGEDDSKGYIASCSCSSCSEHRTELAVEEESSLIDRNAHHVLFIPSISKLKVTGTSDELERMMQNSTTCTKTEKIRDFRPMKREGNSSYPID
jgi:hypothetical protein